VENSLTISYILPCLNEVHSIGKVVDEIMELHNRWNKDYEIIISDSGSVNGTRKLIDELFQKYPEVIYVTYPHAKGKGEAVIHALGCVTGEYVIMVDSDYTYDLDNVPEMFNHRYNLVVAGVRGEFLPGSIKSINRLGNIGLNLIASFVFKMWVRDLCTGLWLIDTTFMKKMKLESKGFTLEAEIWSKSISHGIKPKQIPCVYRPRIGGDKSKLRIKDGIEIARCIKSKRL
jgi:glycosyltransferase involved in cell wall biosynthesis